MIFPSLPTDNISKFIMIGSIIAAVLLGISVFDSDENISAKIAEYNHQNLELKYQIKFDSIEEILLQERIDSLENQIKKGMDTSFLQKKLKANVILISKAKIIKSKRKEESNLLLENRNELVNEFNENSSLKLFLYFVAIILSLVFFIRLFNFEDLSNRIITNKNKKELKEIQCQSCGLILKYDLHPHIEAEFCNTCYDGEKFREPDLTYQQMVERIEKNLKKQNLTKRQVKKHVSKLRKLNRWVKTIRW